MADHMMGRDQASYSLTPLSLPPSPHSEDSYYPKHLSDAIWQAFIQAGVVKFSCCPSSCSTHTIDFSSAKGHPSARVYYQSTDNGVRKRIALVPYPPPPRPVEAPPIDLVDSWPLRDYGYAGGSITCSSASASTDGAAHRDCLPMVPPRPMDYSCLIRQLRLGLDGEDDFATEGGSAFLCLRVTGPEGLVDFHVLVPGRSATLDP